jgi:bacillolysin
LVEGGQNAKVNRRSGVGVVGIDLEAAEDIAFAGFTDLPATANFCAARSATIAAAIRLYAEESYEDNVRVAWNEVGVDDELCAGSGSGDDPNPPAISNVKSVKLSGTKFQITWTTDVPANSAVIFTCCGTYSNSSLVTSHVMQFNGSRGATYTYRVQSTDADGNTATSEPHDHQN